MTRRRLVEILVAALVVLLLVTVFLVRPTARRTEPPPVPLFHSVAGALPDFSDDADHETGRITARSPDGARTALLYPVEFEEPADLYVLTGPGKGVRFTLAESMATTLTPKNVGWIDDRMMWVILGYRWGTVSPGGHLYGVDPGTGEGRLLWACPDSLRAQAVAAEPAADGRSILLQIKVFDENYMVAHDSTFRLTAGAPSGGELTPAR